jgi:hypothetical protein
LIFNIKMEKRAKTELNKLEDKMRLLKQKVRHEKKKNLSKSYSDDSVSESSLSPLRKREKVPER